MEPGDFVNFGMLKHPSNWLIVCLMTIIGLFLFESLASWYVSHINPSIPSPFRPASGNNPRS